MTSSKKSIIFLTEIKTFGPEFLRKIITRSLDEVSNQSVSATFWLTALATFLGRCAENEKREASEGRDRRRQIQIYPQRVVQIEEQQRMINVISEMRKLMEKMDLTLKDVKSNGLYRIYRSETKNRSSIWPFASVPVMSYEEWEVNHGSEKN